MFTNFVKIQNLSKKSRNLKTSKKIATLSPNFLETYIYLLFVVIRKAWNYTIHTHRILQRALKDVEDIALKLSIMALINFMGRKLILITLDSWPKKIESK